MKAWTKAEEDFLKQYYPLYGINYCVLFLIRARASIIVRASKLKVKYSTDRKWTTEEIAFLVKYYPKFGSRYCAKQLHMTTRQIKKKVGNLKISLSHPIVLHRNWQPETKICRQCLVEKSIDQFTRRNEIKCQHSNQCKTCKNDIIYKIKQRTRKVLKGIRSHHSVFEYLGCNKEELINYFKSKMTSDMTWEDFMNGKIHIDHIRPCASFNLNDPSQQKICFHYTNLQPLWAKDNLRKGTKWLSTAQ